MGKHYFGLKEGDFRGRFFRGFSDDEFEEMVFNQLGGELPKGVFAWHLEDGETIHNSKRVQAIAKLPMVTGAFGNWLDPSNHLPKMKAEQEAVSAYEAVRKHTGWIWTELAERTAAERGLDERKAGDMVGAGHLIPGHGGSYYARQSWISKGYVKQV